MVQIFCSHAHKIPFFNAVNTGYGEDSDLLYFAIFPWILI